MILFPAIDLKDGQCVRLLRGDMDQAITIRTLVFNGEIYNYLELRTELEGRGVEFTTKSDTEVLLRSYLEYGI